MNLISTWNRKIRYQRDDQTSLHDACSAELGHPRGGLVQSKNNSSPRGNRQITTFFEASQVSWVVDSSLGLSMHHKD